MKHDLVMRRTEYVHPDYPWYCKRCGKLYRRKKHGSFGECKV